MSGNLAGNDHTGILEAEDTDTDRRLPIGMDPTTHSLNVNGWVWDAVGLVWTRMTQPGIYIDEANLTVSAGDIEKLLADMYWQQTYPYTYAVSGRVKYMCRNTSISAALSATSWYVWKFDDADVPRFEGPRLATGGIASEAAVNALSWGF